LFQIIGIVAVDPLDRTAAAGFVERSEFAMSVTPPEPPMNILALI
jgi:hypothetical protein